MEQPEQTVTATLQRACDAALQKLTKWRTVFVGWQLGTRAKGDPEADAVRDHRELTILLRAEVNALTGLLLKKGLFTQDEWLAQLEGEAAWLDQSYEQRFPGIKSTGYGLTMDARAAETMKGWPQ